MYPDTKNVAMIWWWDKNERKRAEQDCVRTYFSRISHCNGWLPHIHPSPHPVIFMCSISEYVFLHTDIHCSHQRTWLTTGINHDEVKYRRSCRSFCGFGLCFRSSAIWSSNWDLVFRQTQAKESCEVGPGQTPQEKQNVGHFQSTHWLSSTFHGQARRIHCFWWASCSRC